MNKLAVIKTGGKQYLVKLNDEIYVEKIPNKEGEKVDFETLAVFGEKIQLGRPVLKKKVTGQVLKQLKGDKIRVAKFKSKVRYRKVKGHRQQLSKVKITKLS